jgi:hypothetical protein
MSVQPRMEFGIVARTFPEHNVGLIQPNKNEVVFFQGKDRRHLRIDQELNQVVFGGQHRTPIVLKKGSLVVFIRNRYYSAVRELEQAGQWTDYSTWAFLHTYQLFALKRVVKDQ